MITDWPYYDFEMLTAVECAHRMVRRYGLAKARELAAEYETAEKGEGGHEYWRLVVAQLVKEPTP